MTITDMLSVVSAWVQLHDFKRFPQLINLGMHEQCHDISRQRCRVGWLVYFQCVCMCVSLCQLVSACCFCVYLSVCRDLGFLFFIDRRISGVTMHQGVLSNLITQNYFQHTFGTTTTLSVNHLLMSEVCSSNLRTAIVQ